MRFLLFFLGAFATIICIEKPAEAREYLWCTYYNFGRGGATNCGFATFQQCLAAVSGVGGNCGPSPYYQETPYYQRHRRGYPY